MIFYIVLNLPAAGGFLIRGAKVWILGRMAK